MGDCPEDFTTIGSAPSEPDDGWTDPSDSGRQAVGWAEDPAEDWTEDWADRPATGSDGTWISDSTEDYMSTVDFGESTEDCPPALDDCPPQLTAVDDCPPELAAVDHPSTLGAVDHPALRLPADSAAPTPVLPEPVPASGVDLNRFPALAAIDAQGTQNLLDEQQRFVAELGAATADSLLERVQAPGGGLQTTSGMPLVTLGPGTPEGDRLAAALGPLPGGLDPGALIASGEFPSAGVFGPEFAARRGGSVAGTGETFLNHQVNLPSPVEFPTDDR